MKKFSAYDVISLICSTIGFFAIIGAFYLEARASEPCAVRLGIYGTALFIIPFFIGMTLEK